MPINYHATASTSPPLLRAFPKDRFHVSVAKQMLENMDSEFTVSVWTLTPLTEDHRQALRPVCALLCQLGCGEDGTFFRWMSLRSSR